MTIIQTRNAEPTLIEDERFYPEGTSLDFVPKLQPVDGGEVILEHTVFANQPLPTTPTPTTPTEPSTLPITRIPIPHYVQQTLEPSTTQGGINPWLIGGGALLLFLILKNKKK